MTSIKIRTQRLDNYTEVRVLIMHPMENGRNRAPLTNELIPAHYIEHLTVKHNDITVITVEMAGSISQNPFFSFRLKSIAGGDKITVSWADNWQQTDSADYVLP